jgi:hypothetical protein
MIRKLTSASIKVQIRSAPNGQYVVRCSEPSSVEGTAHISFEGISAMLTVYNSEAQRRYMPVELDIAEEARERLGKEKVERLESLAYKPD